MQMSESVIPDIFQNISCQPPEEMSEWAHVRITAEGSQRASGRIDDVSNVTKLKNQTKRKQISG